MGILIILDKLHFEVQYILYSTVTIFLKLKVTWVTFSTQINKYVVFHLPRYFQRKNIEVAQNLFINLRNDTAVINEKLKFASFFLGKLHWNRKISLGACNGGKEKKFKPVRIWRIENRQKRKNNYKNNNHGGF